MESRALNPPSNDSLLFSDTDQDLELRVVPEELSPSDASLRKIAQALLALAYQILEEQEEAK